MGISSLKTVKKLRRRWQHPENMMKSNGRTQGSPGEQKVSPAPWDHFSFEWLHRCVLFTLPKKMLAVKMAWYITSPKLEHSLQGKIMLFKWGICSVWKESKVRIRLVIGPLGFDVPGLGSLYNVLKALTRAGWLKTFSMSMKHPMAFVTVDHEPVILCY